VCVGCVCVCVCMCEEDDNIFFDTVLSFYYESTVSQILNNPVTPEAL